MEMVVTSQYIYKIFFGKTKTYQNSSDRRHLGTKTYFNG